MKYLYALPVVATVLIGGFAMAETVSAPTPAEIAPADQATDLAAADQLAANDQPADAAGTPLGGPDAKHWRWQHRPGGPAGHFKQTLDSLPKPLTADAVKQALEDEFAKRPHVQSVTEKDPNILVVEIVDRNGNPHKFELNRTTGDHRPAW